MSLIHHFCITSKNYSFLENLNIDVILSGAINKDLSKFPTNGLGTQPVKIFLKKILILEHFLLIIGFGK